MNYRDKLYSSYVSTHTSHIYGESTIEGIEKQFPVWDSYFGKFLPDNREAIIIDIGCGCGGFVYWLQKLGYKNACGIDISPQQMDVANKFGIRDITQANLEDFLEGRENIYDVIFARDIIEHHTKEEALNILQTVYKALNIDGVFIIQTPNGESPFSGGLTYGDFTHEVIFNRNSLNQVFKVTGFRDIKFYATGPVSKGLKSVMRHILWKGIEATLRFYRLIETGSKDGIFTQTIIARAKK